MEVLFKQEAQWQIRSIKYNTLRNMNEEETISVNVNTVDNIKIIRRNLKDVTFVISRELKLDPVEVFELSIDISVMLQFNDGIKTDEMNDEEIIQIFKKDCVGMINTLLARASLVISEITNVSGPQGPIITPPIIQEINES